MNVKFAKVKEIFDHAAETERTVLLDGDCYWVVKREDYWYLRGRKCRDTSVYFDDLEDGWFYTRFSDLEYYG